MSNPKLHTRAFTHAQLQQLQAFVHNIESNDTIPTDGLKNKQIVALVEALNILDGKKRVPEDYLEIMQNVGKGTVQGGKAKVIVDSRDSSKDAWIDSAKAERMYVNGDLDWDLTNGEYCYPKKETV